MSSDGPIEGVSTPSLSPSPHKERYFEQISEDDPEYLRLRNMAPHLRQDFNMMEQKKRVSVILQSPSFREELESLIQEQMKKGNNSSNLLALQQIADFMALHGAPASLPIYSSSMTMVTPINDLHGSEPGTLAKGERLMRCKLTSVYRLLDLHGWVQLTSAYLTLRVNKEQDHFLIIPQGLCYSEVTASSLVKVNILGELVEKGSTTFSVDTNGFHLHSAIYSARPDVRCVLHLQTPATAAVSSMKCGILPLSHEALLIGDVAYFDYNGSMEDENDRVELQKSLGPTAKVLVLRNHGILALGDTVEEAFYRVYHIQSACEIQVSSLCSVGKVEDLILLDREKHRPYQAGSVGWAGSTFGPMQKSRLGEHEFEALMRMLDNLGYRTGYAYRHPFMQERTKPRSEVEIPATVTAFTFEDIPIPRSALKQHAHRQQQEKTRWLNTPNTYMRVSQSEGSPSTKTTWLKAEEVKMTSGSAIKIENPNQFVPLFTDPREVLETRNKIREQNRQDVKSAGPQSQLLASVITEKSRSPSADSELGESGGKKEAVEEPDTVTTPEPEPPNPFSQLTDQELEEYKKEVQRKQLGIEGEEDQSMDEGVTSPTKSPSAVVSKSPIPSPTKSNGDKDSKMTDVSTKPLKEQQPAVFNGKEEDQAVDEELSKGMRQLSTQSENENEQTKNKTESVTSGPLSPEGSPSKSPSKKKKKFKAPSFLKKSKKKKETES
ncbi:beta-adducin isoform X1 [Polypterus senegalus]|nr:beta-adducin isoform X1 [Polypterus senegalus]